MSEEIQSGTIGVQGSPVKSKRGSQISFSADRAVDVRSVYHHRIDKLNGISARTSSMIQREFLVADRIGALVSSIVTKRSNLSRFLKLPHSCAMSRTIANIALMEKLEAATPEALVSELQVGAVSSKNSTSQKRTRAQSSSPDQKTHDEIMKPNHDSKPTVDAVNIPRVRPKSLQFQPLAARKRQAMAAESVQQLALLRTRIPVRVAGITVGSFRHLQDRTAAVVPTDDGTVAGGPCAAHVSLSARPCVHQPHPYKVPQKLMKLVHITIFCFLLLNFDFTRCARSFVTL